MTLCTDFPSHASTVEISLYYVIGGRASLVVAVDQFFARLLDDPVLAPYFPDGADLKHRRFVVTVLGEALGGPERYHGPDLGQAHGHLGITDALFDRTAGHLDATLADMELPLAAVLGDDFDEPTREAWALAYNLVAETMLDGAAAARPIGS